MATVRLQNVLWKKLIEPGQPDIVTFFRFCIKTTTALILSTKLSASTSFIISPSRKHQAQQCHYSDKREGSNYRFSDFKGLSGFSKIKMHGFKLLKNKVYKNLLLRVKWGQFVFCFGLETGTHADGNPFSCYVTKTNWQPEEIFSIWAAT